MRLDKYLKLTRLLKRRTQAKELCDEGRIQINQRIAKASSQVKIGQIISIDFKKRKIIFEVLDVPEGNVRKNQADTLYRILKIEEKDLDDEP